MLELYKSIKKFVFNLYGNRLSGHSATRANKLVNIIYGILRSGSCNLSKIASKIRGLIKFSSKVKGVKRWIMSPHNSYDVHYEAFVKALLEALSRQRELVFAIDGSVMGDGCITLMISVIYNGRALPICWITRKGKKGHFPEEMHVNLLKKLSTVVPKDAEVVLLGDGEFDGCDLQGFCKQKAWKYALRTAKDTLLENKNGDIFQLKNMDLGGEFCHFFTEVLFTGKRYGPVNAVYYHDKKHEDPIYLVTNFSEALDAVAYYSKRYLIETFFSDVKSRGFNVHKSKLQHPERIDTLLIGLCLAYVFVVQQALQADAKKIIPFLAFEDKNEASLFTIGLRMIDFCIENQRKIRYSLSLFVKSKFCVPL